MADSFPRFLGAITLLTVTSFPLSAQADVDFVDGSNWTVGYVMNAPHQMLGVSSGFLHPALSGWGVYVDAKLSTGSPEEELLTPALTPAEAEAAGDVFFKNKSAWTTLNLAAMRGMTRELALYLGGGISWETRYAQYLDSTGERGFGGQYWVETGGEPGIHPNVLAGAFYRMGTRLVFQLGAEAAPAGFTAGGHFLLR